MVDFKKVSNGAAMVFVGTLETLRLKGIISGEEMNKIVEALHEPAHNGAEFIERIDAALGGENK